MIKGEKNGICNEGGTISIKEDEEKSYKASIINGEEYGIKTNGGTIDFYSFIANVSGGVTSIKLGENKTTTVINCFDNYYVRFKGGLYTEDEKTYYQAVLEEIEPIIRINVKDRTSDKSSDTWRVSVDYAVATSHGKITDIVLNVMDGTESSTASITNPSDSGTLEMDGLSYNCVYSAYVTVRVETERGNGYFQNSEEFGLEVRQEIIRYFDGSVVEDLENEIESDGICEHTYEYLWDDSIASFMLICPNCGGEWFFDNR